jgi:hypothetical protein
VHAPASSQSPSLACRQDGKCGGALANKRTPSADWKSAPNCCVAVARRGPQHDEELAHGKRYRYSHAYGRKAADDRGEPDDLASFIKG